MKNYALIASLVFASIGSSNVSAAAMDLTNYTETHAGEGVESEVNLLRLFSGEFVQIDAVNVTSFDWRFFDYANYEQANIFTTSLITLADSGYKFSRAGIDTSGHYVFAAPYTGPIEFRYEVPQANDGEFIITNVWSPDAIPPVPEPEHYLMLLAGMGMLAGTLQRRKAVAARGLQARVTA